MVNAGKYLTAIVKSTTVNCVWNAQPGDWRLETHRADNMEMSLTTNNISGPEAQTC